MVSVTIENFLSTRLIHSSAPRDTSHDGQSTSFVVQTFIDQVKISDVVLVHAILQYDLDKIYCYYHNSQLTVSRGLKLSDENNMSYHTLTCSPK